MTPEQQPQPVQPAPQPNYYGQPNYTQPAYALPADPGKTLGIIGLILAIFMPLVGLILSIISHKKSTKAGHSGALGTAGIIVNILFTILSLFILIPISIVAYKGVQERAAADSISRSQASQQIINDNTSQSSSTTDLNQLGTVANAKLQSDLLVALKKFHNNATGQTGELKVISIYSQYVASTDSYREEWTIEMNGIRDTYVISMKVVSGSVDYTISK